MPTSRRVSFSLLVIVLVFVLPTSVLASAYESGGFGSRAISMGGAYIGLADDWTAIYWNPAGLAQLTGWGVGINSDYLNIETKDGNSIANPLIGQTNADQGDIFFQLTGTEPREFNKKKVTSTSFLPALGVYYKFHFCTIEIGAYVPLAFSCSWEDAVSGVDATYKTKTSLIAYNISAARQITPQLSLGLGLNILDGSLKRHAKKATPLYTYILNMKAEGIQLQGILGLLYRPFKGLAVGVSYKTGSQAEFKGDASATYPFPSGANLVVLQEKSDYTQRLLVPVQIGLGVAYTALEKLTLTADWVRTDWSDFYKDIDYKVEDVLFKDSKVNQKWVPSNRIRLGAEYCPAKDLAIRAGFGLDPRGVCDRAVSQTNLIDTDRKIISFGVGYKWNDLAIALGYVYAFGKETIQDVEYEKNTSGLVSSLQYKF